MRRTPYPCSKEATILLIVDGENPISSAAVPKLPNSTDRMKARHLSLSCMDLL